NTIGGSTPDARNIVWGVGLVSGAIHNRVQGNYIGVRANGLSKLGGFNGSSGYGVDIDRSSNNLIGGTAAGETNVIFGGVTISAGPFFSGAVDYGFSASLQNRILGNLIGVGI